MPVLICLELGAVNPGVFVYFREPILGEAAPQELTECWTQGQVLLSLAS